MSADSKAVLESIEATKDAIAKKRGRPRKPADAPVVLADVRQDMRPEMRPEMRMEDPREAAERRAAIILGNLDGQVGDTDEFRAPPPPDGWTYEWKTHRVMGKEDPAYRNQLERFGWEDVPTARHPEMMPHGHLGKSIIRKDMILMMRPKIVTDKVRDADRQRARYQVRAKEEQLGAAPQGQFGRDHEKVKPRISKSYGPIEVPKD